MKELYLVEVTTQTSKSKEALICHERKHTRIVRAGNIHQAKFIAEEAVLKAANPALHTFVTKTDVFGVLE